jgi:hypothetical protein
MGVPLYMHYLSQKYISHVQVTQPGCDEEYIYNMDLDSVNCSSHIRTKEKRSFTFKTQHLNYYSTLHHYRRLLEWYFATKLPFKIYLGNRRFEH